MNKHNIFGGKSVKEWEFLYRTVLYRKIKPWVLRNKLKHLGMSKEQIFTVLNGRKKVFSQQYDNNPLDTLGYKSSHEFIQYSYSRACRVSKV